MRAFWLAAAVAVVGVAAGGGGRKRVTFADDSSKSSKKVTFAEPPAKAFDAAVERLGDVFDKPKRVGSDMKKKMVKKMEKAIDKEMDKIREKEASRDERIKAEQQITQTFAKKFAIEAFMELEGETCGKKLTGDDSERAVRIALRLRNKDTEEDSDRYEAQIIRGLEKSGMDVFEDGVDLYKEALFCVQEFYKSVSEVNKGKREKPKAYQVIRKAKEEKKPKAVAAKVNHVEQPQEQIIYKDVLVDRYGQRIEKDVFGNIKQKIRALPNSFRSIGRSEVFSCRFDYDYFKVTMDPYQNKVVFHNSAAGLWKYDLHHAYAVTEHGHDESSYVAFQAPNGRWVFRGVMGRNRDRFFYDIDHPIDCQRQKTFRERNVQKVYYEKPAESPTPVKKKNVRFNLNNQLNHTPPEGSYARDHLKNRQNPMTLRQRFQREEAENLKEEARASYFDIHGRRVNDKAQLLNVVNNVNADNSQRRQAYNAYLEINQNQLEEADIERKVKNAHLNEFKLDAQEDICDLDWMLEQEAKAIDDLDAVNFNNIPEAKQNWSKFKRQNNVLKEGNRQIELHKKNNRMEKRAWEEVIAQHRMNQLLNTV